MRTKVTVRGIWLSGIVIGPQVKNHYAKLAKVMLLPDFFSAKSHPRQRQSADAIDKARSSFAVGRQGSNKSDS
jgi:hypothetical protein